MHVYLLDTKAFGDSLTHGMYNDRVNFTASTSNVHASSRLFQARQLKESHPYTIKLEELFPNEQNVTIIESGVSGEITARMVERLEKSFREFHQHPLLTIILGGTNDLRFPDINSTVENIITLHAIALKSALYLHKATYTIAMTLPQFKILSASSAQMPPQTFSFFRTFDKKRLEINNQIRKFVSRCHERVGLLDLENVFDQREESNAMYWSPEMIHFSIAGYDRIGEMLYEIIQKFQLPDGTHNHQTFLDVCFPATT